MSQFIYADAALIAWAFLALGMRLMDGEEAMSRSVLDFRPVNFDVVAKCGAEPSLRDLVFKYYGQNIPNEVEAVRLARDYCDQIETWERDRK